MTTVIPPVAAAAGPGTPQEQPAPQEDPGSTRDPWPTLLGVGLLLAVVAAALSLLSVINAPRLSALDEATHIDYAYRAAHGELPVNGQVMSQYTLDAWACRGQANIPQLPACAGSATGDAFPVDGLQYNAFHPPLYYEITGWTARALAAITGDDFVTMARSLGAVWLFAGMFGLYLTLRYWRMRRPWALAATLLIPTFPTILHAASIVSNDAPALLAGVAALFVLGRTVVHQRDGWLLPVVLTALATATKTISSIGLLAVAVTLLVIGVARWRADRPADGLRAIRNGVFIAVTVAIVQFGWSAISSANAVPGYVSPVLGVNTDPIVGLPFDEWLPTLFDGARLGSNFYLDPLVDTPYLDSWVLLISTVVAAAGLIGLALFRRAEPEWIAAGTLVIGVLACPLVVQLQTSLRGYYFPIVSDRYATALLPLAVAVLAMIAARKRWRITAGVLVGAGGVATVCAVLFG